MYIVKFIYLNQQTSLQVARIKKIFLYNTEINTRLSKNSSYLIGYFDINFTVQISSPGLERTEAMEATMRKSSQWEAMTTMK